MDGAAIFKLIASTVTGNTAADRGGGISFGSSGLAVTITISTISNNTANETGDEDGDGGGINVENPIDGTITGSTISGNRSSDDGGGIDFNDSGSLSLTNSTVSGNRADNQGGGIASEESDVTIDINGSRITGNLAGNDPTEG